MKAKVNPLDPSKAQVLLKKALLQIKKLEEIAKERAEIIDIQETEKDMLIDELSAVETERDLLQDEVEALRAGKTL
jgi:hypothetical protein